MSDASRNWLAALGWLRRLAALLALGALVLDFGVPLAEPQLGWLQLAEYVIVAVFAVDAGFRLAFADDKRGHLRENRLESALLLLFALGVAGSIASGHGHTARRLLVLGIEIYMLATVGLAVARLQDRLTQSRVRPELLLLASFVVLIAVGTGLLLLPASRAAGAPAWSLLDAVFTATSAVCVTGLSVRDVGSELSFRGQAALLAMIQVGGLGLVTLVAVLSMLQRGKLRLRQIPVFKELFPVDATAALRLFVVFTLLFSLCVELLGAWILRNCASTQGMPPLDAAWWGLFHSVSAFCNAGFGLSAQNLADQAHHPAVALVVAGLIVVGGLGFPVLLELASMRFWDFAPVRGVIFRWLGARARTSRRFSLHTKLTLVTTAILITGGATCFWIAERGGTLAGMTARDQVVNCLFQSITARTAGFNTLDVAALALPTVLLMVILMAIGAAPLSTGGGIKTSAIAVLFCTLRAMVAGHDDAEAFGRTLPRRFVNAAVAVVVLYATAALIVVVTLVATQKGLSLVDCLFESVSALSTVGLSRNVTGRLDDFGRIVVCVAMLVGRVGPVALLWIIVSRPPSLRYEYPEENVVVS